MIFERFSCILWKWILLKQLIIQSLRYIWNHQFSARGKGVKFSSYDSLTISPIVALFAVRARVVFVCGRGADVDYRKLCKGENQCTQSNELRRERDKGRQRKTQSLREEREKGDSSRNTEREESFPGRCLAPNCMPESDCISSSFSLPFSPSLFHSRSSSLARWVFASFKLSLPPQQYATPETWHKKRYCATPWNFLLRPCRYPPPPFSIPSLSFTLGDVHSEKAASKYITFWVDVLPLSFQPGR